MTTVKCSSQIIEESIAVLRKGMVRGEERVILWLGRDQPNAYRIAEIYEPEQVTDVDYFRIPPESMRALMSHLRKNRLKIIAQLHTHPGRAFHSLADDRWAIIRHVGALSLVLPYFAAKTTPKNFLDEVMTYELSPVNEWLHVDNRGIEVC